MADSRAGISSFANDTDEQSDQSDLSWVSR